MRLILVRHAEAAPGEPDELRPLTPRGREQARELASGCRAPDAVLDEPAACGRARPQRCSRVRTGSSRSWTSGSHRARPTTASSRRSRAAARRSSSWATNRTAGSWRRGSAPARLRFPPGGALRGRAVTAARRGPRPAQGATAASRPCAGSTSSIEIGEVFGLLGPNGAGKTTTVEILEGYRSRDARRGHRARLRPGPRQRAFRARIGVVLQQAEPFVEPHRPRDARDVRALLPRTPATSTRRSRSSGSRRSATRARRRSRAARSGGSTSASRSSATPTCSSSTSRPPASTRRPGARPGR